MAVSTGRLFRPVLSSETCRACMVCRRGCPAEIVVEWRGEEGSQRGQVYGKHFGTQVEDRPYPNVEKSFDMPPCQATCPIGQDVRGYVSLIAEKKYGEAARLIRETNALPGVTGYICHHPCESACVRRVIDEPVSIRGLKRFAMSRDEAVPAPVRPGKEARVVVIGSGPAGLSAAYDLAREGYPVEVLEGAAAPGGMLRWAVPSFRLPREVLDRDIKHINELGVVIKTGVRFGVDVQIAELKRQGAKAVILATGTQAGVKMGVKNEGAGSYIDCLAFLRKYASGECIDLGERVAVIGGGNAAIDSARAALRCGARECLVVYRRSAEEMPADREEVSEAEAEGVKFSFLTMPLEFVSGDGRWQLKCVKTRLGRRDASGRRKPVPVKGSGFILDADTVIAAVGQQPDLSWNQAGTAFNISSGNTFAVDGASMTNIEGIFAAGDAVNGPTTVVEAMSSGRKAARAVHQYLSGREVARG